MSDDLLLTIGRDDRNRMLAIITRGGHPQIPDSGTCEVCDLEIVRNVKHAKQWFRRMKIERPWETRQ